MVHRTPYGDNKTGRLSNMPGKWKLTLNRLGKPIPEVHAFPTETALRLFLEDTELDEIKSISIWQDTNHAT